MALSQQSLDHDPAWYRSTGSLSAMPERCLSQTDRHSSRLVEGLARLVLEPPAVDERFGAVFLDANRAILGHARLGTGCANSLAVRLRDLFERALSLRAPGLIMAHNHPSGDCRPSDRDVQATQRVSTVGRALDIELLDHLIFTQNAVYSMRAGEVL